MKYQKTLVFFLILLLSLLIMGSVNIILGKSQYQFKKNINADPAVLADRQFIDNQNKGNTFRVCSCMFGVNLVWTFV